MEVDTGSGFSLISRKTWKKHFPSAELARSNLGLRTYTSQPVKVLGQMSVEVSYGSYEGTLTLHVVGGSCPSLLGRDWLQNIQLDWASVKTLTTHNSPLTLHQLMKKYANVLKTSLRTMTKFKTRLHLKEGARPRFCHPRTVPFALKEMVAQELERRVRNGTLRPVEHSEWTAPIVAVPKQDGSLRICGDYKVTINQELEVDISSPHPQ